MNYPKSQIKKERKKSVLLLGQMQTTDYIFYNKFQRNLICFYNAKSVRTIFYRLLEKSVF